MEYIINQISKALKENNMSAYALAKAAKINAGSLNMILHNNRKMSPKYFYAIIDNLPFSAEQKADLINRYQRVSMSEDEYIANKYIRNMLNNISDFTFSVNNTRFLPPPLKLPVLII